MNREHVSDAALVGRLGQKPELGTPRRTRSSPASRSPPPSASPTEGRNPTSHTEWTRAVTWGHLARRSRTPRRATRQPHRLAAHQQLRKGRPKHRVLELHADSAEPALDPAFSKNEARLARPGSSARQDARSTMAPR